jgi:hypothetical protein
VTPNLRESELGSLLSIIHGGRFEIDLKVIVVGLEKL